MVRGVEAEEVPGGVQLRDATLLGRLGGGLRARHSAKAGFGGGTDDVDLVSGVEPVMEDCIMEKALGRAERSERDQRCLYSHVQGGGVPAGHCIGSSQGE